MNFLLCSIGRRAELVKYFKDSLGEESNIIAIDNSNTAPALYFADKYYIVPRINDEQYLERLEEIVCKNNIDALTTLIDPEIEVLAKNREILEELGVIVMAPNKETANICFDKFKMYEYLVNNNIDTVKTYDNFEDFKEAYSNDLIKFPVFIKPRTGSGSVGARKINNIHDLCFEMEKDNGLIIQEFMDGIDIDVDVYIDTISKKPVSLFAKRKIETKIGGANKTISFKDDKLFALIEKVCSIFEFNGPIDMDFFYKNNNYYLSEINPRFGGAYLHAYRSGIDFIKLIKNNVNGIENKKIFGDYDSDIVMMMYDSVVIKKLNELP